MNLLICSSARKGLMNLSYEIAKKYKRQIIGIAPEIFKDSFKDLKCTKEIITKNISERTTKLIEESDALIFLPGGIGTIYELFTAIESKRSGEFNKKIIIYNSNNYFDKLLLFIEDMYNQNFTLKETKNFYYITTSAKDTINYLQENKQERN